jgi:DNA-binding NarL/FixJ family response regulator
MLRILIADDHDAVRLGLRNILESHPEWEVAAEACDGSEAISMALQTKPDIAVLDFAMPLINGVEVTRQIRQRLPKTEVLIFSFHERRRLSGSSCVPARALTYLNRI